jgi:hypothetical protein
MKDLPGYIYRQTKAEAKWKRVGIFPLAFANGNGVFETGMAQKIGLHE